MISKGWTIYFLTGPFLVFPSLLMYRTSALSRAAYSPVRKFSCARTVDTKDTYVGTYMYIYIYMYPGTFHPRASLYIACCFPPLDFLLLAATCCAFSSDHLPIYTPGSPPSKIFQVCPLTATLKVSKSCGRRYTV